MCPLNARHERPNPKDPVKKKQIIQALAEFDDEDDLAMDDLTHFSPFHRICGKGQYAMPYKCVKNPGHSGECYCACKQIHFKPDPRVK